MKKVDIEKYKKAVPAYMQGMLERDEIKKADLDNWLVEQLQTEVAEAQDYIQKRQSTSEYDEGWASGAKSVQVGVAEARRTSLECLEQTANYEAEVERLKEVLKRYGHHDSPCIALMDIDEKCICGFDQALQRGKNEI